MNTKPLKIVADENIPAAEQLFSGFGEVIRIPGRHMSAADVVDADLLLVRSITKVNKKLLENSSVKFVGTATIGTDHIDQDYLQQQGIHFTSAPGCNADAVAEYVISVLSLLAQEQSFSLQDKTVGIIGVGNVGGRLRDRLRRLGIKLLLNDPPRRALGLNDEVYTDLETVLTSADIICMHTPLTTGGDHPSRHLLNSSNLTVIKENAILLNAGRGPVIDNQALLEWHQSREDVTLVLDVWEHEPAVDTALADRVRIGTPHIAGYSLDGKIRGTYMLYDAFCKVQGITPAVSMQQCLPSIGELHLDLQQYSNATEVVHQVYDPRDDDQRFRASLKDVAEQPKRFDQLRKEYPVRREFASVEVSGESLNRDLAQQLAALGFKL